MFDVPIATMDHMQVISALHHHDMVLIHLGQKSALKDLEDAVQSTSGPLEANQKRGASAKEDPCACLPISPSITWKQ